MEKCEAGYALKRLWEVQIEMDDGGAFSNMVSLTNKRRIKSCISLLGDQLQLVQGKRIMFKQNCKAEFVYTKYGLEKFSTHGNLQALTDELKTLGIAIMDTVETLFTLKVEIMKACLIAIDDNDYSGNVIAKIEKYNTAINEYDELSERLFKNKIYIKFLEYCQMEYREELESRQMAINGAIKAAVKIGLRSMLGI